MHPLRKAYTFGRSLIDVLTLRTIKEAGNPAFQPNKGKSGIWLDHLQEVFSQGTVERGYWMYGFYNKTRSEQEGYMPYLPFMIGRNDRNLHPNVTYSNGERFNYLCLLRDKFIFQQLIQSLGFPIPRQLFLIDAGRGVILSGLSGDKEQPVEKILDHDFSGYFKIVSGECGGGVFKVDCTDGKLSGDVSSLDELKSLMGKGIFIVQETITQHPALSALYPGSVNTIRLITYRNDCGDVSNLPAVLRVGAHGMKVDNWAQGGLAIWINNDGLLKGEGHYEWPVNGKMTETKHPDTGIVFDGYPIPYLTEAVSQASRLHRLVYGVPFIGWDIAITSEGPVFIEGNDNFEISLIQAACGGLKPLWGKMINGGEVKH